MIFIAPPYREHFRQTGFAAETIFRDPSIRPWRVLPDRENCTWDISLGDRSVRLHVKRFPRARGTSPAQVEADGYRLLTERNIPTADIVAWGVLDDGRSFIAIEDLSGFAPLDKLIEQGRTFTSVLSSTADLAAKLHGAELHHRDLYLCHFMAKHASETPPEIRLIDAARVRQLPGPLTRRRWIVKDLAQFWFSTLPLNISDAERDEWLCRYCGAYDAGSIDSLRRAIVRKVTSIGAHDVKLRRKQPGRNISIPD